MIDDFVCPIKCMTFLNCSRFFFSGVEYAIMFKCIFFLFPYDLSNRYTTLLTWWTVCNYRDFVFNLKQWDSSMWRLHSWMAYMPHEHNTSTKQCYVLYINNPPPDVTLFLFNFCQWLVATILRCILCFLGGWSILL